MEPLISREQTMRALCAAIDKEAVVSPESVDKLLSLAQTIFQSPFWAPSDLDKDIAKALTKCYQSKNDSISGKVRDFTKKHFSKVREVAANDLIFEIKGQHIEANSLLLGSGSEYIDRVHHSPLSSASTSKTLYTNEDPFLLDALNHLISGKPVQVRVEELKPLLELGDQWLVTDIREKVDALACSLVDANSIATLTKLAEENSFVELQKTCRRFTVNEKFKTAGDAFRTLRHKWNPEKQKLDGFHFSLTKEEKMAVKYLKEFSKEISGYKELALPALGQIKPRECLWLLSAISPETEIINLSGADFTDLKILARFKKLREIDLSNCVKLVSIAELEHMPSLKKVNLSNCESLVRFEPLHRHRLEYLNLIGCQEAFFADLPYWLKDVAIF